jgi:cysteine desulfurase family protein (TIGR01976 family)
VTVPDLSPLRARFPALTRQIDGRPCAFLDAPGGSQVPDVVIEAMASYLRTSNANSHGAFVTSEETDAIVDQAHRAAADLVGSEPDQAVFGPNATTLLFAVSRSIGRTLGPGDEVVVTRLDHDANVRPWVMAAEDAGATVRWVDLDEEHVTLDLGSFDAAVGARTKVVAFTLASNAVGTVTPAAELVRRVRERSDALVVCDAVHYAQHRLIDVGELGCDLLACSPYKIFGPHLGILFGRRDLLSELRPYKVRPAEEHLPFRWETGTQNHEGLAGFGAAVDYLAGIGRTYGSPAREGRRPALEAAFQAIGSHESELARRFLDGVRSVPRLRLYGIADPARLAERTPTFAVRLEGQHPADTAKALGEQGIFTWDGNYYALELMERLGLEEDGGALRIGFCHYNTTEEVDRVLQALSLLA